MRVWMRRIPGRYLPYPRLALPVLCPFPARSVGFPAHMARTTSIFTRSHRARIAQRAGYGVVSRTVMANDHNCAVKMAKLVESASSVGDRLGADACDPGVAEEGVIAPSTSSTTLADF